jgi:hypothetical protein
MLIQCSILRSQEGSDALDPQRLISLLPSVVRFPPCLFLHDWRSFSLIRYFRVRHCCVYAANRPSFSHRYCYISGSPRVNVLEGIDAEFSSKVDAK